MAAAVALVAFVVVWLIGGLVDLFLLGFAGVLLALFLDSLASQLARHTPVSLPPALTILTQVGMGIIGGGLVAAHVEEVLGDRPDE